MRLGCRRSWCLDQGEAWRFNEAEARAPRMHKNCFTSRHQCRCFNEAEARVTRIPALFTLMVAWAWRRRVSLHQTASRYIQLLRVPLLFWSNLDLRLVVDRFCELLGFPF